MGLWIRAAFGNNEARTPGANARGVMHAFASIDSSDVGRGCLDAGQHQCARAAAFPGARASRDESASPDGSIAVQAARQVTGKAASVTKWLDDF